MKFTDVFRPRKWISHFMYKDIFHKLSDKNALKLKYYATIGKRLNLDDPQTFNEKIQWLKLYDQNPMYTTYVDKYAVKAFVKERIGEEYIIPTIGVWDNPADIDFASLPSQFVLKVTHDSGGLVICKDKSMLDWEAVCLKLNKSLARDYYMLHREWPYKNVPRRIIAETYMEDEKSKELPDYKFFCFHGEPKMMFIATGRQNINDETRFDFFDMSFNHLAIKNGHPNADTTPAKPQNFDLMIQLAKKLSQGIPHVRVDFYEMNGQVYFGEMTFSHWSGFVPFEPESWDYTLGQWIDLKQVKPYSRNS